jgi:HD-GYP domain-containing protein (c-di-GMP phosphodiesterase class II)
MIANDEMPTGRPDAPDDLTTVHAQLIVFARELSEMYYLERERSQELEGVLRHVQETYVATMKTLAQVVEAKDRTTRGHLDRSHSLGVELARRVDPELAKRPEVGYGFFLHDIGKVGIPEDILRKNGSLSDPEWTVMREHPVIGAEIVAPMQFLGDAVDVIRHHHERFDGTGYPSGMKGEEIPLAARIFSVADSFDAMTSDRPYRDAMASERATEELREGSGSQFDPDVVEVFLDLVEEENALASAS